MLPGSRTRLGITSNGNVAAAKGCVRHLAQQSTQPPAQRDAPLERAGVYTASTQLAGPFGAHRRPQLTPPGVLSPRPPARTRHQRRGSPFTVPALYLHYRPVLSAFMFAL